MKSEKMTPLLQSMWLQVLWILWTLWFVLDPAWDLFASGVEWLLSMGVLGWFLGLVALALAVSLFRTYGPAGGILSIMATFLLLWGIGDGLPGALLPNPYTKHGHLCKIPVPESQARFYLLYLQYHLYL